MASVTITPVPASQQNAQEMLELRDDLAKYQAETGFPQWHVGEVTLAKLVSQIDANEWYVQMSAGRVAATVRIVYDDPELWPEGGDAGYIHGVMVRRDMMGQGLGTSILGWAEARIREAGRSLARLDCAMTSNNLRRYYLNRGYFEVGEVHPPPESAYEPAVLLEKPIV